MRPGGTFTCDRLIVGCGYLGTRVAARWLQQAHSVAALTRSADRAEQLRLSGIIPVVGDLTRPDSLTGLPVAGTVLIAVGLDRNSGNSQREVYVEGLKNLLTALPGEPQRVILISSTSVYGQDHGEWVDEDSETLPQAENGRVCLEAEQVLHAHDPGAVIIRSAGIYGPGRLIARVESLRTRQPIGGNPHAWLNLIHVDDLAAAVEAVAEDAPPGSLWLASDTAPCRRQEYYALVARLAQVAEPVFSEPPSTDPGVAKLNKRCSSRRLREQLHLSFRYPTMNEGLPQALGLNP